LVLFSCSQEFLLHHQQVERQQLVIVSYVDESIMNCEWQEVKEKKTTQTYAGVMSADLSGVDWPLVLGSFATVVLFLCSVALVVVVARRKGMCHMNLCFLT